MRGVDLPKGVLTTGVLVVLFESAMIALCSGLLYKLAALDEELYIASKNRLEMIQAADTLRQSSDDLTNFARSYAATNNEIFKENYFRTLNIRNGDAPRPLNYEYIYWDLKQEERDARHPQGEKLSLKAIFHKLPFTKEELSKLDASEANSNELVKLEVEAFNAMAGKFKDSNGEFSLIKEPNPKMAVDMLYSKEYYDAKHKIMYPIDEFMSALDSRTQKVVEDVKRSSEIVFELFISSILVFIIGNFFTLRHLNQKERNRLTAKIRLDESVKSLEMEHRLNEGLERQVEEKAAALIESERLLAQQAKMAMMGEMIVAIAHQWRQPLNSLGITIQDVKAAYEFGELDDAYINKFEKSAMEQVYTMSKTIDDFKNFFSPNKKAESFFAEDAISESLNILNSQLKIHSVAVLFNKDGSKHRCVCYKNELKQALLNILANAKDALFEKNPENKFIKISVNDVSGGVQIEIEDSAGGIADEIIDKIFDAHFTTKAKSGGTGIGLYMTKQIIEESIGGTIWVENTSDGSKFTIVIPFGSVALL